MQSAKSELEALSLPLTMPAELWGTLSPAQQAVYRRAEALLDRFGTHRSVDLSMLLQQGPRAEVLRALHVLGGMSLVDIEETSSDDPKVTLRATPEEHVRVVGPDGRPRWIFVARPLDPPPMNPSNAN